MSNNSLGCDRPTIPDADNRKGCTYIIILFEEWRSSYWRIIKRNVSELIGEVLE